MEQRYSIKFCVKFGNVGQVYFWYIESDHMRNIGYQEHKYFADIIFAWPTTARTVAQRAFNFENDCAVKQSLNNNNDE